MLKLSLHTSELAKRTHANQAAVLDIAYARQAPLADYMVALTLRGSGEMEPAVVSQYPRWAGSLWELVARAAAQLLYRAEQIPPARKPDRRCAYGTRLCATIEKIVGTQQGLELGTMELTHDAKRRRHYHVRFTEDILGERSAEFDYGCKGLNPVELLMRAICWTYHGSDQLGPAPRLILPATLSFDGVERFQVDALPEPARTGFRRYQASRRNADTPPESLARAEDYALFLMRG